MKKFLLIPLMCTLFLLASCRDYNELNMQSLVKCAGVDFADGRFTVTVTCDGDAGDVLTSRGTSFFDAVREMSARSNKKLYWGHTETVVFGEAALSEAFEGTLDAILRARDVFLDVVFVVAKDMTAEDALSEGEEIFGAFANEGNSRRFDSVPLWELLREREMTGVCVIPTVRKDGDGYVMSGGAVMSDGGFLGYLSEEEFLLRSLLRDETDGGYLPTVTLSDGREVSFEILANDVTSERDGAHFVIRQRLMLSPAEVRGSVTEEEMRSAAEETLARAYREFIASAKVRGLGNIFALRGADGESDIEVLPEVRISNVLGGD